MILEVGDFKLPDNCAESILDIQKDVREQDFLEPLRAFASRKVSWHAGNLSDIEKEVEYETDSESDNNATLAS